jgi:predicted DNA-binding transcriptional regulator AlpA
MHPRHLERFAAQGLLTAEQCAAKWGLTKQNIMDRINGGGLPKERVMGRYYGIRPEVDPRTPAEKKLTRKQIVAARKERQDKRYHKRERDKRSTKSSGNKE